MSRPKIKRNEKDALLEYAHEQLAVWEALRKLGFQADDIYAAFYNDGELFTTLKAGGKEWNYSVSHTQKVSSDLYIPLYTAECERWNTTTQEERRKIFMKHMPVDKMIQIAISIRIKDIEIPKMPDAPSGDDMAVVQAYMEGKLVFAGGSDDDVQAAPN